MIMSKLISQELRERVMRGKYRIPFYMSTDCESILKKILSLKSNETSDIGGMIFLCSDFELFILCIYLNLCPHMAAEKHHKTSI